MNWSIDQQFVSSNDKSEKLLRKVIIGEKKFFDEKSGWVKKVFYWNKVIGEKAFVN